MIKLIFALCLCVASCAVLESKADGVYLGGWSKHVNQKGWERRGYGINQDHNLMMVEFKDWEIGTYKTTHFDTAVLAGRYFELFALDDIKIGVHAGVSYGYKYCNNPDRQLTESKFCPALMPEFRFTRWKLQPALLAMVDGVALSVKIDT
jgi:hypothetical protein